MRKIWQVARFEYVRHVRRRAFVFAALGVPLLIVTMVGVAVLLISRDASEARLGWVDLTGSLPAPPAEALDLRRSVPLHDFADEASARRALDAGTVDAYVVVAANYLRSGRVRAVGPRPLSDRAETTVRAALRQGVLAAVPPERRDRVSEPAALILRRLDSGREIDADSPLLLFAPYGFALLFLFTSFTTAGYLLQAVAEEKEQRVIEILATSLAPEQIMAGKIVGLSAVGLSQMLFWLAAAGGALLLFGGDWSVLSELQLPTTTLALLVLYFVLGFVLLAASYAAVGAAVATPQEAQPLIAPISLLAFAPMLLLVVILAEPNGTISVVLSLLPFSAPMTMLMRLPLADVPAWQILASSAMLLLSATGAVLLAARVMRRGMLRYGQRLQLREIVGAWRPGSAREV